MLWNFESERTAAHRFPGELHTSGVGSGANYQLPMSKGHHVLPMLAAWEEYYAEAGYKTNGCSPPKYGQKKPSFLGFQSSQVELFNAWKSPHWDIVFLPMTGTVWMGSAQYEGRDKMIPDLSRNSLPGKMVGNCGTHLNRTTDLPTVPQGVGSSVQFNSGKDPKRHRPFSQECDVCIRLLRKFGKGFEIFWVFPSFCGIVVPSSGDFVSPTH